MKRLQREPFVPYVQLEDDAFPYDPGDPAQTQLTVPADADAVLLGLSNCGIRRDREEYGWRVLKRRVSERLYRIGNMLSLHAILVLTRRFATNMLTSFVESAARGHIWDLELARTYPLFNVYALARPIWYQDGRVGGQELPTRVEWTGCPDDWDDDYHTHTTLARVVQETVEREQRGVL